MTILYKDYYQYLSAYLNLLYFVGCYTGVLSKDTEFGDFLKMDLKLKYKCRNAFLEQKEELLNEYLGNRTKFLKEELDILNGFKKNKQGQFILLKCLKQYSVFKCIDDDEFYAVKSLGNSFEELIPRYPIVCELNILTFKDQIIYDGFIKKPSEVIIGNMKKSLLDEYSRAKKSKKIIFSLD